ncbi:ABC transporter ATP-binding protein [Methanocella sp. CWC-04]|uniref:Molybdate/tungstate import ATP-binding protein WtpC n=1 Tax=Methanooceanicella nereidis TaxID=2052831 RepID=A0AAP2W8P7_9EURY|nr:ABC transporter ATP-binding protein [Methanocella sp. CWC-04]MCD1296231.1 ABC transporter ATP-binding protein [Methanocella sp. CWC-04]
MLEVFDISKRYGERKVLDKASLSVKKGDIRVIIGLNGSGKSTILKIIAGIVDNDEGAVKINKRDVTKLPPEDRKIGYVPQNSALFKHMSVEDNIKYCLKNNRGIKEDLANVISLLGLEKYLDKKPQELSGGYKCRVALARALLSKPEVMLLDEPLTEVDYAKKQQLLPVFKNILKEFDIPVIYITHDPWEAGLIGNTFSIMEKGKLISINTPDEAFEIIKGQAIKDLFKN